MNKCKNVNLVLCIKTNKTPKCSTPLPAVWTASFEDNYVIIIWHWRSIRWYFFFSVCVKLHITAFSKTQNKATMFAHFPPITNSRDPCARKIFTWTIPVQHVRRGAGWCTEHTKQMASSLFACSTPVTKTAACVTYLQRISASMNTINFKGDKALFTF